MILFFTEDSVRYVVGKMLPKDDRRYVVGHRKLYSIETRLNLFHDTVEQLNISSRWITWAIIDGLQSLDDVWNSDLVTFELNWLQ
jgi:hypothetical protein